MQDFYNMSNMLKIQQSNFIKSSFLNRASMGLLCSMFGSHFFNKLNVVCHGILLRHAFPAEPRIVFGLTFKVKHARLVYVDITHHSLLIKPIKVLKVKVNSTIILEPCEGRGFGRNSHLSVTASSVFESVALILFLMSSAAWSHEMES